MLVASTNRRPRIPNYFARLLSATAEVTNRSSPTRDKIIATVNSFYPRRVAMLAPYSHGPVSVCLSGAHRYCVETDERTELVFGIEASFDLSYSLLLLRKVGHLQR